MSRRSAEAEENHWPGFVDALSTIVMVVTFLLIILAVVIAVLAQNVSKFYLASESEKTQIVSETIDNANRSGSTTKEVEPTQDATQQTSQDTETSNNSSQSAGNFKSEKSEELKSEDEIEGNTAMNVLSTKIDQKEERIEIEKAQPEDPKKVQTVESSDTALTLVFDASGIKIDEASASKIENFLSNNTDLTKDQDISIWSFGDANSLSISEQKRMTYYRALAARNELLQNGFDKDKIKVEVRFSPDPKLINTVRIIKN